MTDATIGRAKLQYARRAPTTHAPASARPASAAAAGGRRLLVATDAWRPQVNGVVRTLEGLARELPAFGVEPHFLTPDGFPSFAMPGYPQIPLAVASMRTIARRIEAVAPEVIHIATEGPIGFLVRRWCIANGVRFTTCYHTRYPEYLAARLPVPLALSYAVLRRFHGAAAATMVATDGLRAELAGRGFSNLALWRRGVDTALFTAGRAGALDHLPRPIFLCVARVAVEKNIEAFLALDLPGSKVVVGDGPARADLASRFSDAHFLGLRAGRALADIYASSDVFVFPSRTDTFGLVMLEAMAAGLPVAAFPVTGPQQIITDPNCGIMDEDLGRAARAALDLSREACRAEAARHTMQASARSFLDNVSAALGVPRF